MVSKANSLPVGSTTAAFTPVRMPGSSPKVALGPAGAASNKSRKLLAKTLMASISAASRKRSFKSRSIRVNSLTFHAILAVSASQASAGNEVSVTFMWCATRWAQRWCSSLSSLAGFRVRFNKSSLRPLNNASARCEGILLMAS